LTPDIIANVLWRGFADHINKHGKWRDKLGFFFDGKTDIEVVRDDFEIGNPDNDWESVFKEFAAYTKDQIDPSLYNKIHGDYSTTGYTERLASNIVLMDTAQRVFSCIPTTRCGIPEIAIHGTLDDWNLLKERFQIVKEFGLDWWAPAVEEILDEIIKKVCAREKGEVLDVNDDDKFWTSIISVPDGSVMTGWLLALFPYVNGEKNEHGSISGVRFGDLPGSSSVVSLKWKNRGKEISLKVEAGIMGTSLCNGCARPEFGWVVHK
jgi:hypothetical protein